MGCSSGTSGNSDSKQVTESVSKTESDSKDDESAQQSGGSCSSSSREEPIGGNGSLSCGDWDIKVAEAVLVSNQVIYDENMFNDLSDSKSWVAVTVEATYKGDGLGDIGDVVPFSTFLIGKNNVAYEDDSPTGDGIFETFGPPRYDATDPYSGGTVKLSLWFWVDNSDSDLVLGMFIDDPYGNDPNAWVDVSADRS
jgi:hypothetical protein